MLATAQQERCLFKVDGVRELISTSQLENIVKRLSDEITRDYERVVKQRGELVLLGILKGSFMFLSDLSKCLQLPHQIDFMRVSSYDGDRSSGGLKIECDTRNDIEGKHVIIVEDIVDTGNTLNRLVKLLKARNPKSLKCCALLDKPAMRTVEISASYVGCVLDPPEFVVGYGLDYNENYRGLSFIGIPEDGNTIK